MNSVKAFIDLGAFTGDTLKLALNKYKDFDRFYAFEPSKKSFEVLFHQFRNNRKVILCNSAAYTQTNDSAKLYHHMKDFRNKRHKCGEGSSLEPRKTGIDESDYERVKVIDFSEFIKKEFIPSGTIILKIDIEGSEYNLLDKMIKDGTIGYINEIFCEWHFDRLGMNEKQHFDFVRKLRKLGYNLSGTNLLDEFIYAAKFNPRLLWIIRNIYFYTNSMRKYFKYKYSKIYHSVKDFFFNKLLHC